MENIGSFYRRIQLKTPNSSSLDRYGQTMVAYTTASMWAQVKQNGGSETNLNGYVHSTATYEFVVRRAIINYGADMNEKCIINWNNIDYNIVFVEQIGKLYMRMVGERRISNG